HNVGADPATQRGRPLSQASGERPDPAWGPTGVVATACLHRTTTQTREAPAVGLRPNRPPARERSGRRGVADRLVVPWKPGNAGGGKGPDLGRVVEVTQSRGVTVRSSTPLAVLGGCGSNWYWPAKVSPSGAAVGGLVKPVGEPDAGNPHVLVR